MRRAAGSILPWLLLLAGFVAPAVAQEDDALAVVNAAKAAAGDVPAQARALVQLTWGDATDDPLVRAAARQELVYFGHYALPAVRMAIKTIDPVFQADATVNLIEARERQREGNPPDFLPGLDEAIWFGSVEAKRIAIYEISRYPFPPAVLTTIDAIHDHPELTIEGLRALGRMRDQRGRFFLARVLQYAAPRFKREAAVSLGDLGENGTFLLRQNVSSEDRGIREAAVAALLPHATPTDLTSLHEYVGLREEDDPDLLARIREKAIELEIALEEIQMSEAASPDSEPDPEP